ncbi:MAG TPA: hypothetical protein VJP80_05240 [Candidatus Saccharimonadales bacterium]|nr:hypothetical protein [Candidatus Saccharimonadales bacterium]
MAKTPKRAKKSATASQAVQATHEGPRTLQAERYRSFRLRPRIKHKPAPHGVPSAFRLFGTALGTLKRNWILFGGILLVYAVLEVALVQGVGSSSDLANIKQSLDGIFKGSFAHLSSGASLFLYLAGSQGSTVAGGGAYQFILGLIVTLAIIWALREVWAGRKARIRESYYRGMHPLVPLVLVLVVILLQCIPLAVGAYLYSVVSTNGLAASAIEQVLWVLLFVGLAAVTLYMVCSSLFAVYIVCLPGMTPLQALRSARILAKRRRLLILRKLLFLPVAIVLIAAVLMIPIVLFATAAAPWLFFAFSIVLIGVGHSYMYALYRSLL